MQVQRTTFILHILQYKSLHSVGMVLSAESFHLSDQHYHIVHCIRDAIFFQPFPNSRRKSVKIVSFKCMYGVEEMLARLYVLLIALHTKIVCRSGEKRVKPSHVSHVSVNFKFILGL